MAELHILGEIYCASEFAEQYTLFCRYSVQTGPNWTLISGHSESQTVSGKPDYMKKIVWNQPLDLHYVATGIQGWPKIVFQVHCLDSLSRSWIVGYGVCNVPAAPGFHGIEVPCWIPAAVTVSDRLRQYFFGGSHQLSQTDIINSGTNRCKLHTQSKGKIQINVHIVARNFTQFGIEYK